MRIAVLNWTVRRVGGAERYLTGIVPALRSAGHAVGFWHEVDTPVDREGILEDSDPAMWSVARLGARAALDRLQAWKPDVLYNHGLLSPRLESRVLDVAPAVLFAHSYYGTCISGSKATSFPVRQPCPRAFGPACLLHFYPRRCGGLSPVTMGREYARQAARLQLLSRYIAIVTQSEHMRREYSRYRGLEDRVRTCSYAIDPAAAPPIPNNELTRPHRSEAAAHLLFVGRMDDLKGGDIAIDTLPGVAAALGRPIVMTFAGDGPRRGNWEARARRVMDAHHAVDIRFPGWRSNSQLAEHLSEADLLVVPSLWPEPYGLVGLEAGRRGVPAAAFAVGGIPEWLKSGENGELAPADPPRAAGLTAAIVGCLIDPRRHAVMRERARALAMERDNADRHLDTLVSLLARAAGSSVGMPR